MGETKTKALSQEPSSGDSIRSSSDTGRNNMVDIMKKIILATVAVVAFSAPSFAAETGKTVGQAPPSFYLAQDSATMKCQVTETQPVAGGSTKVIGTAHSTKASAETALKADKTCAKQ